MKNQLIDRLRTPSGPLKSLPLSSRNHTKVWALIITSLVFITGSVVLTVPSSHAATSERIFDSMPISPSTDPDTAAVELGIRFIPKTSGTITAIRFYRPRQSRGPFAARLWDDRGRVIAKTSFSSVTSEGWQTAVLPAGVRVTAGKQYTASYSAPRGRYAATQGYFSTARETTHLKLPRAAGVYKYRTGAYPTDSYRDSNYYVDVQFVPSIQATPTPTPTATPTATGQDGGSLADLPRIPWEGGSAYYAQFPVSAAGGWASDSFFPIATWWNVAATDGEVRFDLEQGINTYVLTNPDVQYDVFASNGASWIGGKLNESFPDHGPAWAGRFLDDEIDGRFPPAEGLARLRAEIDQVGDDGRFKYANFTSIVTNNYSAEQVEHANQFVNMYEGPASVTSYWYTDPFCDREPYVNWTYVPVTKENCRTASSYGRTVQSLRARDATDGKYKPIWAFVELMGGGTETTPSGYYIQPEQIKGAAMNAIINGASGIIYFNSAFQGACETGNVIRSAQLHPDGCTAANVAAMSEVNHQIKDLAPVLNTQSYAWSFGSGLDTMLKTRDGSIYVFAMVDGRSQPGPRTFQLPPGVRAESGEVLFEGRTVNISADGSFTDDFARESDYHIYRITPPRPKADD